MSPSAVSLATIFVIVAMGGAIGFLAGVHRKMDLEQWTVGGRGFGAVLMFLLMAGEVYTTFAFLGASGWAYSRGGPTLYIMAYLTLAYVVSVSYTHLDVYKRQTRFPSDDRRCGASASYHPETPWR